MWIVAHQLAIPSGTNQILKNSIVYIFTDIHIVGDLHLVVGVNQWPSEFISTSVASLRQLAFKGRRIVQLSLWTQLHTASCRVSAGCPLDPNVLKKSHLILIVGPNTFENFVIYHMGSQICVLFMKIV